MADLRSAQASEPAAAGATRAILSSDVRNWTLFDIKNWMPR
jgi:hypothetical protein